mmetsp:Transcript_120589/g.336471  ORF Transcript_120589/g.336471 Transcript_120589/m.336471 type:complete len:250 (+) Transcript_120589:955-1704(+)
MPRPSWPLTYSKTAAGSCSMTLKNFSSCKPQSHLADRRMSPVKHSEWMRTATLLFPSMSPLIAATTSQGIVSVIWNICKRMPLAKLLLRTGIVTGIVQVEVAQMSELESSHGTGAELVDPETRRAQLKPGELLIGTAPCSRVHLRNSSTVMSGILCCLLKDKHSSRRIISPSSRMSSPIAETVCLPARRHKSYADSVWPPRSSTPPGRGQRGNMWPGLEKSSALLSSLQKARTVSHRSRAETPVVVVGR